MTKMGYSRTLWLWNSQENFWVLWFIHIQNTVDLQQLKGINAKFLTTYVKGVPFINGIKVYERSTFSVKNGI